MESLSKILRNPQETIFEIVFFGTFNIDKLSPLWFFNKNLIGRNEAKNVNEKIFIQDKKRNFSTAFFDIVITKNNIKIGIIDVKNLDILSDIVIGLMHNLKSSTSPRLDMNLRLHFLADSKQDKIRILNSGIQQDFWGQFLEGATGIFTKVERRIQEKYFKLFNSMSISECYKQNLRHPYHINVFNEFYLSDSKEISEVIDNDVIFKYLKQSIDQTNNLTEMILRK